MGGQFSKEIRRIISKNNSMYRETVREKVRQKQKARWTKDLRKELSKENPMYDEKIF